jgi:hypothetical protein
VPGPITRLIELGSAVPARNDASCAPLSVGTEAARASKSLITTKRSNRNFCFSSAFRNRHGELVNLISGPWVGQAQAKQAWVGRGRVRPAK